MTDQRALTDDEILGEFPAHMRAVRVPPGWKEFARNIERLIVSRATCSQPQSQAQTCPRCGSAADLLFTFEGDGEELGTTHCGCLHDTPAASTQQSEPSAAARRCEHGLDLCGLCGHPAPSASPAALTQIREKLARFMECAEDDEGVDIGRNWLDALTTLGLLARAQRSPARWEMTDAGDALLASKPSEARKFQYAKTDSAPYAPIPVVASIVAPDAAKKAAERVFQSVLRRAGDIDEYEQGLMRDAWNAALAYATPPSPSADSAAARASEIVSAFVALMDSTGGLPDTTREQDQLRDLADKARATMAASKEGQGHA